MQENRFNSLDPILIPEWRWSYFLNNTAQAFSIFKPRPYQIENKYLIRESSFGSSSNPEKVFLATWGFQTNKIRQARCACLKAGKMISVMNLVISPSNSYELPFFGADFVTLPNGHLIALDLQPAMKNDSVHTKYVWNKLKPIHAKWQSLLPKGGKVPDEALEYFSPGFLWSRIPLGDEGDQLINKIIKPAFNEYLKLYLNILIDAREVTTERSLIILDGQRKYMNYRAKKDPARGMLTGFFGNEWTENYINHILFDLQ